MGGAQGRCPPLKAGGGQAERGAPNSLPPLAGDQRRSPRLTGTSGRAGRGRRLPAATALQQPTYAPRRLPAVSQEAPEC